MQTWAATFCPSAAVLSSTPNLATVARHVRELTPTKSPRKEPRRTMPRWRALRGGQLKCGCDPPKKFIIKSTFSRHAAQGTHVDGWAITVAFWDEWSHKCNVRNGEFDEEFGGSAAIGWRVVRLPKLSFRSWWLRTIGPTSNWTSGAGAQRSSRLDHQRHLQLPTC